MRISDWISDVCSSDLRALPARAAGEAVVGDDHARAIALDKEAIGDDIAVGARARGQRQRAEAPVVLDEEAEIARSAERRLGKECVSTCSYRWSATHSKKKKTNYKQYTVSTISQ